MPPHRLASFAWVLMVVCVTACGNDETSPSAPDDAAPSGPLLVTPDSILIEEVGAEAPISATVGGAAVDPVLTLRHADRWLDDVPVLDLAALRDGRIVARSAGRAVVDATSNGGSDSLIVTVRPATPVVTEVRFRSPGRHLGDPDTLLVRGFGMLDLEVENVSADGAAVWLDPVDSANARLVVPTMSAGSCSGTPPEMELGFDGIPGPTLDGLTRRRAGELDLSEGEARRVAAADAACLRIAPTRGTAEYLLAYVDRRLVDKAQTEAEWPWPDSIVVSVEDWSDGPPSPAGLSRKRPEARVTPWVSETAAVDARTLSPALVPAGCPFDNVFQVFCRSTPYVTGEVFTYYPADGRPAGAARIVDLRGSLALGVFLADSTRLGAGALFRADTALSEMHRRVVPRLRLGFALSGDVATSDESGQLLLMIEQASGSSAQWFPDATNGHGRWGKVTLQLSPSSSFAQGGDVASMLNIMAHEVTHPHQFRWRYEHADPWLTYLGTAWAVEGGASFVGLEAVREWLGIDFDANYDIQTFNARDPVRVMWLYTATSGGGLTRGYTVAASFLRDVVQRLVVDGGLTLDAATSEVLVGSLEGWWGINEEGWAAGPGLTARMRQALGPSWTPVDALLQWRMSQAADDLTDDPRYQNVTVRSADEPTLATNMPGAGPAMVGDGTSTSVTRAPGTTGIFLLQDSEGGSYVTGGTVGGQATEALEWLVLRIS